MNELKPCPFCGKSDIRIWKSPDEYWQIQCNNDECCAQIYDNLTEEQAVLSWNTRASDGKVKLFEATLKLIAFPEMQNDYTPQQLAKHALRIEPLPPPPQS